MARFLVCLLNKKNIASSPPQIIVYTMHSKITPKSITIPLNCVMFCFVQAVSKKALYEAFANIMCEDTLSFYVLCTIKNVIIEGSRYYFVGKNNEKGGAEHIVNLQTSSVVSLKFFKNDEYTIFSM